MNSRFKFTVVMGSTCAVLLLLFGSVIGKSATPTGETKDGPYRHLAVFTEVISRIKSEYVEEPDMKSVTLGAINGLLESVDPFSSYLNPDQYKEFQKAKSGAAETGLILSKKFGYMGVVGVLPNSSAAKQNISTGDMIETIKGVTTRDMPLAYAEMMLRGDPNSTIEIGVVRVRKSTEPQTVTLTRAAPQYPAVAAKMQTAEIGYLKPETLAPGKVKEAAAALESLKKQGAKKIILDLRNTAVGEPEEGYGLANLFVEKGLLGYLQGQKVERKNFDAAGRAADAAIPMVVLTNRGTAHAAEVAAAALLESKRAEVMGERTYGWASRLNTITMDDGGAVILSVAKYYSPNGKSIPDNGVTPGTLLQELDSSPELDENGEPVGPEPADKKDGEDLFLKRAVEALAKK